jgi:hypothetical protein
MVNWNMDNNTITFFVRDPADVIILRLKSSTCEMQVKKKLLSDKQFNCIVLQCIAMKPEQNYRQETSVRLPAEGILHQSTFRTDIHEATLVQHSQ